MSTSATDPKTERLTVYIRPDLRHAVRVAAAIEGQTITDWVTSVLSAAVSACESLPGREAFTPAR